MDQNDEAIFSIMEGKRYIWLIKKSDLNAVTDREELKKRGLKGPFVDISALNGSGREELEDILKSMFAVGDIIANDQVFLTNERQKQAFRQAKQSLEMVIESIDSGMAEDFYTIDLMNAYSFLGEVIGESVEEDLVNRIFSKFCMGK